MAFEAPSGLMGIPNNLEDFEAFEVDDIIVYLSKDVLSGELKDNKLNIYIEGYGRYQIEIR